MRNIDTSARRLRTSVTDGLRARIVALEAEAAAKSRADAELARARVFNAALLDTTAALIVVLDREGRIVRFNPACERATGYTESEVLGRQFWTFLLLPEEQARTRAVFDELCAGQVPNQTENYWRTRDGARRLIAWSSTAVVDRQGAVEFVIGTGLDISERQQVEAALQESHAALERRVAERTAELAAANARLQRAVEEQHATERALRASEHRMWSLCASAPIGIFELDAAGRCVYANERLQAICGLNATQCLGDGWPRCIQAESGEVALPLTSHGERGAGRFSGVFRLVAPGDYERWVTVRTAALSTDEGSVTGYVGTVEDMTEHLRIEDEIRQRELELAHVARVSTLGEMATTLAHELNQPLAVIANYALGGMERARLGRAKMEDLLYALERIGPEARRAGEIIHTMREFVRKRGPQPVPARLDELVHDAVRLAEPEARRLGARIRLRLARELPPVTVDRVQIEQVILNLIRNGLEAQEHTPADQREVVICTAADGSGGIEVAVHDRGCGLDAAALAQVFEPFYTTKPQGMGLGLPICRSVVQSYGGRLWAESVAGAGATFRFVLPGAG